MQHTLPSQVGPYAIYHHRLLGHGTYGEVCVGEDTRSNTEVAVKRVTSASHVLRHVERELETLRAIRHPNVIRLLHHETVGAHTYLVLELCDFDLQSFAQLKTPEFASLKLRFVQDSTVAVRCLHEHSIIHRDLKPENFLVKDSAGTWIIKVSDFGLARRIPDGVGSRSFSGSAGLGTLAYMAPEVLPTDGRASYSKPADVYSLGLLHLSIVEHTSGPLLPKTVKGQSLGQWIKEEQRSRGVEAVDVPRLTSERDTGVVLAIKRLVERMVQAQPSSRCKIGEVYEEIQRIKQHGGNGQSLLEPHMEDSTASSIPPTDLYSSHLPSSSHHLPSASLPKPDLESMELGTSSDHLIHDDLTLGDTNTDKPVVALTKLHRRSMPHKPHRGLINFGLGQELDALWLESQLPDQLHYSQYQEGNWIEAWTKEVPVGQQWNCRKFVNSSYVLLQSLSNDACFYRPDTLELAHRVRSPGWVVGLTGQGLAVVGNHASPVVATQGVKLHLSQPENLVHPVVELRLLGDKAYGMNDFLWAYGSDDGHVVVTNDMTYVDLFAPDGQHTARVDLGGDVRRPSCTARHVFVPVRRKPPTIAVLTWGGEVVRRLGVGDLGLRENEWCWSISPVHDGKLNVLITDTDDQDYIVTYQIEEH